jgi:hypothetical protein
MKKILSLGVMVSLLVFAASAHAMMGSTGTMGTYMMQMPTGQQMYEYGAVTSPIAGSDVSTAMPLGVGAVATGGNTITVQAAVGQFSGPMDMYITAYAPGIDPFNIYVMHQDGSFWPVSAGFEPYMTGVTSINQTPITNMATSSLPKGTYTLGLMATPSGSNISSYYFWTTHFAVQ